MNVRIQWSEIRSAVENIARGLRNDDYQPDVLLAVARGGLIPAVMLSHALAKHADARIELLEVDKIHKYFTSSHVWRGDLTYLVIDDIYDTGDTFAIIAKHLKKLRLSVKYAFLYARRMSLLEDSDFYIANIVSHNDWLEFPWERPAQMSFN